MLHIEQKMRSPKKMQETTHRLGAARIRSCNKLVAVSESGEGAARRLTTLSIALHGDIFRLSI